MSLPEAIGVDLGGTKMLVGVVDAEQEIHYTEKERSTGQTEDELVAGIERELNDARAARPGVLAAGVGVPCTIDRDRGMAIQAVNLPISDVPLRDILAERIGLPVFLDNDATVAALAEHRLGAAKGARDVVLLTVGTGIGGGLIINDEVYRGSIGAAAELGHVVIDINGPPCQGNCPSNGCLETMASGTALAREGRIAAERAPDSALGKALAQGGELTGRTVSEAALAGDAAAREVVALIGTRLGVGLAGFANTFNPDVMVIGGGVIALGDLLLEPAREELRRRALRPMNETPVVQAQLGPNAGMIGAATMALMELEGGS